MNKSDFTLFWAIAPAQADWDNLIASGVRRVMLTYELAATRADVLSRLAGVNCRVVIRIEQQNARPPTDIARELSGIARAVHVDAVIVGCEPDTGVDFLYGAPDWGQQRLYASLPRLSALIGAIRGLGLQAVSPALSDSPQAISEDGEPLPGRVTWREIAAPVYQRADGCAAHLYSFDWATVVDQLRFKFQLKRAAEEWHLPLWLDEVGVIPSVGGDVQKMASYLAMADIVMAHPAGARVKMFCPFISAGDPGNPPAWDARYLVKDRAAYTLLGRWLVS